MASKVLILVQGDPRVSHRPTEAVRIALGLFAANLEVHLILSGDSYYLLTTKLDNCIDGDLAKQYLISLKSFISTFYVEQDQKCDLIGDEYPVTFLSRDEIEQKIALAELVIRF
ncbi:MAG: hypothetical protein AAB035_03035 [Nitrospirota bacterium]